MDRAYIDYAKFEELTQRGVIYVTNLKKSLKYRILEDKMYITPQALMEVRIQKVLFTKKVSKEKSVTHTARIITYADERKTGLYPFSQTTWTPILPRLSRSIESAGRSKCCSSR